MEPLSYLESYRWRRKPRLSRDAGGGVGSDPAESLYRRFAPNYADFTHKKWRNSRLYKSCRRAGSLHQIMQELASWVASIPAAASAAGCSTLYPEDLGILTRGRPILGVRVQNPFL